MPRFVRLATQDWQLKLLAVALAVLLWVVVSAEQVSTTWIDVPFTVQESDPDFQLLAGSVPERVRVRVTGPGREFIDLAMRRPSVVLRVGEVRSDEQAFPLLPSMVRLPDGHEVSVQDIDPPFARLRFLRLASRELPVAVALDTSAGEWTLVAPLRVTPSRVRVRGPAERVPSVASVSTMRLRLPPREGPFDEVVALDMGPLRGLEVSTPTVRVAGRSERLVSRRIGAVSVSIGPGLAISPTQVDVRLDGPRSAVESASPSALRVVLALDSIPSQIPPGGLPVRLRLEGVPPAVRATLDPSSVRLLPDLPDTDSVPAVSGVALRARGAAERAAPR